LLVAEILMLLGGVVAFLLFIAITLLLHQTPGWPHIPTEKEIQAITDIWRLRDMAVDAYEKLQAFVDVADTYRWFFLIFGSLLFLGSIVHFILTPWKLREKSQ